MFVLLGVWQEVYLVDMWLSYSPNNDCLIKELVKGFGVWGLGFGVWGLGDRKSVV